jgi:hypothetical protein
MQPLAPLRPFYNLPQADRLELTITPSLSHFGTLADPMDDGELLLRQDLRFGCLPPLCLCT